MTDESQHSKMLSGALYDPEDPELSRGRTRAQSLCQSLNASRPDEPEGRQALLGELLGIADPSLIPRVEPPFFCDYGSNIRTGKGVFLNFNCVILDPALVTIGDHVLFGPGVHLYTATHPLDAEERRSGLETAEPITIGADVWLGGGVVVCPGVTIGERTVIGAGSVVTKDIPADVVAAGNPCRVIRRLKD